MAASAAQRVLGRHGSGRYILAGPSGPEPFGRPEDCTVELSYVGRGNALTWFRSNPLT